MFKLESIKKIVENEGLKFYNKSVICASAIFSDGFYGNNIEYLLSQDKNQVIHFGDKGISFIVINELTGEVFKDNKNHYAFVPNEELINIRVKFGLIKSKLIIETKKGIIKYGVTRSVLFEPWHAENFSALVFRANGRKR